MSRAMLLLNYSTKTEHPSQHPKHKLGSDASKCTCPEKHHLLGEDLNHYSSTTRIIFTSLRSLHLSGTTAADHGKIFPMCIIAVTEGLGDFSQ